MSTIEAEPFALNFDLPTTALIIIDTQRDFVLPGYFDEMLGNDTSLLSAAGAPTEQALTRAREKGIFVVHTREGHRPDLSDGPPAKLTHGGKTFIGASGPMGRILVRGHLRHEDGSVRAHDRARDERLGLRVRRPQRLRGSYFPEFQRVLSK